MEGEAWIKQEEEKEQSDEVKTRCWTIVTQCAQSMSDCLVTMSVPQDEAGELRCSHWGRRGTEENSGVSHRGTPPSSWQDAVGDADFIAAASDSDHSYAASTVVVKPQLPRSSFSVTCSNFWCSFQQWDTAKSCLRLASTLRKNVTTALVENNNLEKSLESFFFFF